MLGLRTTIYKVSDLGKAKEWYSKAFEKQPYFDEPFYVGFNIGGFELGLQPEDQDTSNKTNSVLSYWGVVDIRKAYDRLIKLGGIKHEEPTNVGGEIVVCSVLDPWGNALGLIYNPDFVAEEG